jgi:hypothetical protein
MIRLARVVLQVFVALVAAAVCSAQTRSQFQATEGDYIAHAKHVPEIWTQPRSVIANAVAK